MHPDGTVSQSNWRVRPKHVIGTTIVEVVIACVLLSAALVSVGTLQTQVARAQQTLNQRAQMRSALLSARELISSWPPSQITAQRIQAIPIEPLEIAWPAAMRWEVRVAPAAEPWSGLSVFLDLTWEEAGQVHSTGGLTFWVHEPLEADLDVLRTPTQREAEQP